MSIVRSFLLRISIVLLSTTMVCFLVMGASLAMQSLRDEMQYSLMLALLFGLLLGLNVFFIRKAQSELSMEVARLLFPSGAVLSVLISILFLQWLDDLIPGDGRQHWVMIFVGLGIASFLLIRCFDIKWLRSEEEIQSILRRHKK
jgi:hypothetical protein